MKGMKSGKTGEFMNRRKNAIASVCLALIFCGLACMLHGYNGLRLDRELARAKSTESLQKIVSRPEVAETSIGISAVLKLTDMLLVRKDYPAAIAALQRLDSWKVDAATHGEARLDMLLIMKLQRRFPEVLVAADAMLSDKSLPSATRVVAGYAAAQAKFAQGDKPGAIEYLHRALAVPSDRASKTMEERLHASKTLRVLIAQGRWG